MLRFGGASSCIRPKPSELPFIIPSSYCLSMLLSRSTLEGFCFYPYGPLLLVLRFLPRLKLLKSERPLLLVPPRAMLLSVIGTRARALDSPVGEVLSNPGCERTEDHHRFVPTFRDVSRYAIHADFFPFSVGPHYATYPEGGVAGNYEFTHEEWDAPYRPTFGVLTKEVFKDPAVCKTVMDQFPTPREMVWVESLFDDQLTGKMTCLLKGYKERSLCANALASRSRNENSRARIQLTTLENLQSRKNLPLCFKRWRVAFSV
ncbi:hypothetical protein Tco_1077334 [Tanacetum coccineum]